jgi:predicted nucleic acid-binding protein
MIVFVDTSALYAGLDRDDINHKRVKNAWTDLPAAARRKLSLVDCISFQTMREYGAPTAFCFDPHFREQGFDTIP